MLGFIAALIALPVRAASISVTLDGVDGELKTAALAAAGIDGYANREVSAAQAQRLFERARAQIAPALEPYGYYHASVAGELTETAQGWNAVLHVTAGEPVTVASVEIDLPAPARDEKPVAKALAAFAPAKGERFDHAAYEKSKVAIQTALIANGYLDAALETRRVEVSRGDNRAAVTLKWHTGQRYRYAATHFSGAQFFEGFLERYLPWHEGDFYTQTQLLQLQQRLIDADYFSIVEVHPDSESAREGSVPIVVNLAPAKRSVYTTGVFYGTDSGAGVRAGLTRRWVNLRGHKLKFETEISQRLKTATALYAIPLPGAGNRSYNFGASFRDQNTDTSQSRTTSLVANESRQWMGFTRTLGLHLLTGNFKVADEDGSTTLLYPEAVLERKQADDPTFVRHGYSLTLAARASPGLLSETHFEQVRADAKWIRGIGESQRVIVRGTLGATQVGDFDKLPPELRFFAGGDRTIRGYAFETIGPRNANALVIGGEDLAIASAEYEYYFTPHWGIATFIDSGDSFSGFGTFDLKVGTGIGVRWRSPVGMVRVDLGTPLHDKFESGVQLHIVIGPDL